MIRNITLALLTALIAVPLSTSIAAADHHERKNPPTKEHQDHGNHEGHDKMPKKPKGDDMSGHEGHGDHSDHGKKPKGDAPKK